MKILFVCTGNTCRSCMAEAIFNEMCDMNDVVSLSRGVSVVYNSVISKNAAIALQKNLGIELEDRKAIQLDEDVISKVDLILTMTKSIKEYIEKRVPMTNNNIFTLGEYVGASRDISDPYGGAIDVYDKTFFELKKYISLLISKIKEDNSVD